MAPRRLTLLLMTVLATGCGQSSDGEDRGDIGPRERPEIAVPPSPTPISARAGTRRIASAVRAAGASPRQFTTTVKSKYAGQPVTYTMTGTRSPDGTSTLTARRASIPFAPLPSLRIANDRVFLRRSKRAAWQEYGGADGIALDVGRELLTHDFLLHVRPGLRQPGDVLYIPLRVTAAELATQAAQDPNSPIANLLKHSTGLLVIVKIERGDLACVRIATRLRIELSNGTTTPVPLTIEERSAGASPCRF